MRHCPFVCGRLIGICLAVAITPSTNEAADAASPIVFADVTTQTGITFRHTDGGSGRRYIQETVTAGLALFDYDGDGDVDIYFINAAPLDGTRFDVPPRNALYRNDGDWRFTDVTAAAGVGDTGYGLGVAVADYDNDGDQDIFVNNFGPDVLYRNNGDGTFADITRPAGTVGDTEKVGAGACFLDGDGDGDLDLYASSYLAFTYKTHIHNTWMGHHVYPGPDHYHPVASTYYRNNGDGTFSDESQSSGIGQSRGRGMGTVCADYDQDGDTDLFVANDSAPNFLFQNDGQGRFTETGLLAGVAYDEMGQRKGSMAAECADYDNDGLLDFYVTSYQDQHATLYRNLGDGLFEDVTVLTGAAAGTFPHVTWGTGLMDFDNDGDRDLYIACGHLYDNVDLFSDATAHKVANILLLNNGAGKFVDISRQGGDGMRVVRSSRGAAFDDLDQDGDVDVVVLNSRDAPTILRNDSPRGDHHWLLVQLKGVRSNRGGVGAQVRVVAGDLTLVDEVHSGRGYQSHFGERMHFGLGSRTRVDRIEVRWIGGQIDVVENVAVDQLRTIVESTVLPKP